MRDTNTRTISPRMARRVVAAYGEGCWLGFPGCTRHVEAIDHVQPVKSYGPTLLTNLRPACTHCNAARGARVLSGLSATIHAVIGPPAAGKTTFVAEHKNTTDLVLDYDSLAASLMPGLYNEHNAPDYLTGILSSMWSAAYRQLVETAHPVTIWLIKSLPVTRKSPRLLEEWQQLNYSIHVIDPGRETIERRLLANHRTKHAWNGMKAWYKMNITQENVDTALQQRAKELAYYQIGVVAAENVESTVERVRW